MKSVHSRTSWTTGLTVISVGLLALAIFLGGCSESKIAPTQPEEETGLARLQKSSGAAEVIADQYIVVFKEEVANPLRVATELARAHGLNLRYTYGTALKGFAAVVPAGVLQALQRDPRIAYIEQDRVVRVVVQTLPTGVDRIDADQNATADIDGQDDVRVDVDIAILDTGIDPDHPDLNVVSFFNCTDDPDDDGHGHGSHVAGTAAAIDNDIDAVGVAPGARLWAVKVLDDAGSGSNSSVICGIDYVTDNADQIEVANMSLSGTGHSQAMQDAIINSVNAGVFYAVAAGNDAADVYGADGEQGTDDDVVPAAFPEVATVSAMADLDGQAGGSGGSVGDLNCLIVGRGFNQTDDTFACFSNFSGSVVANNPVNSPGMAIDVAAPGYDIFSTYRDGGTATLSGTSMASPHVAGAAALYIAENGRATDADGVASIRQALIDDGQPQSEWRSGSTEDPDGNLETLVFVGTPAPPPEPPAAPSNLTATTVSSSEIDLAWDDNSDNEDGFSIERRTDSSSFAEIATVGANVTSFSDTGLDASTTYTYRVRAFNDGGNSDYSNEASATTEDAPPPAGTMHVDDITVTVSNLIATLYDGTATVTILDENGDPVANATVTGDWSQNGSVFNSGASATTGSDGVATIESGIIFASSGDVIEFCVTDVTNSLTYEPADNVETCDQDTVP